MRRTHANGLLAGTLEITHKDMLSETGRPVSLLFNKNSLIFQYKSKNGWDVSKRLIKNHFSLLPFKLHQNMKGNRA